MSAPRIGFHKWASAVRVANRRAGTSGVRQRVEWDAAVLLWYVGPVQTMRAAS